VVYPDSAWRYKLPGCGPGRRSSDRDRVGHQRRADRSCRTCRQSCPSGLFIFAARLKRRRHDPSPLLTSYRADSLIGMLTDGGVLSPHTP
jgi:hypothetical protein